MPPRDAQVGGATAQIGDPSFREQAKTRLDDALLAHHAECIRRQIRLVVQAGLAHVKAPDAHAALAHCLFLDNREWQRDVRLLDFLDGFASKTRLASMLRRERCARPPTCSPTVCRGASTLTPA